MKIKKLLASISALALLGSMAAALPASAAVTSLDDVAAWMDDYAEPFLKTYLEEGDAYEKSVTYTTDDPKVLPASPAKTHFDLRDVDGKNYVTPMKDQGTTGTCWAFSAMTAAETSAAYERGIDLNTADAETAQSVVFSPRYLAWFNNQPLPENPYFPSQAGEGIECSMARDLRDGLYGDDVTQSDINYAYFNIGGFSSSVVTLFPSFQGPQLESRVPFGNNEGTYYAYVLIMDFVEEPKEVLMDSFNVFEPYVTEDSFDNYQRYCSEEELKELTEGTMGSIVPGTLDWYHGTGRYYYAETLSPDYDGTWDVDASLRFTDDYRVEQINILPSPRAMGENDAYRFDLNAVNAIKSELVQGRAVSVGTTDPNKTEYVNNLDENLEPTYQIDNVKYCCQYTYDPEYDPSDPESINRAFIAGHMVTIIGYDDNFPKEYFNDPNGTIGGDGAFIAINSWGTDWGEQGYCHISYYDQSLDTPMSIDFDIPEEGDVADEKLTADTAQIYDLLPAAFNYEEIPFDNEASIANVFTADEDMILTDVSYNTHTCNEKVNYAVYLLEDDAKNPTDGVLAGTVSAFYTYGGFHKTALKEPIALDQGQRYSVVVTAEREDGKYGVNCTGFLNADGENYLIDAKFAEIDPMDISNDEKNWMFNEWYSHMFCANAVVNAGESFLMTDGAWTDWADVLKTAKNGEYSQYLDFDNFSIKAYGTTEILNVVGTAAPQKNCQAGDTVDCTLNVRNVSLKDAEQVYFTVNGEEAGKTERIASKESMTVTYPYTVTEEDVENGAFRVHVQAFCQSGGETRELDLIDGFSTPTVTVYLTGSEPETEPEPATEPTSEPASEPATDPATAPVVTEPATDAYTAEQLCDMAVKDYEVRTGTVAGSAEATENPDGSVTVRLLDDTGALLSTYQLDPVTGTGTDSQNNAVDLPQTGNTAPGNAAAAAAAAVLTVTGAFLTLRSCRKREE